MPRKKGGEGEYDDEPEADPPSLSGSLTPSAEANELGQTLLQMHGEASQVLVLLGEASEEDFKLFSGRLESLVKLVNSFPRSPRPSPKIGFKKPRKK